MPRQWIRPYQGPHGPSLQHAQQQQDRSSSASLGIQSLSSAPSLQGLSQLPAAAHGLSYRWACAVELLMQV